MDSKIAAGIVLFNPEDSVRLRESIKSVIDQFSRIYVFDNSTEKADFLYVSKKVIYMTEHENKGIAYALNRIMERAMADGFQWVVTMDQDSVLPQGIVDVYKKYMEKKNIAIICPQVIDKRRPYMVQKLEPQSEFVDECITSGSCTAVNVWKKLGGFDEWLFVDLVDNEFCKRAIVSGYKILRVNSMIMNQEFGKIIPKSEKKQNFWLIVSRIFHNENFAKFSYKKFVSPLRVYYTNRNIIYVNKKLSQYGKIAYQNYNCKGYLGFWIAFNLPSLLRAQDKKAVLHAIFFGIRDGKSKKVKKWVAKNDEKTVD